MASDAHPIRIGVMHRIGPCGYSIDSCRLRMDAHPSMIAFPALAGASLLSLSGGGVPSLKVESLNRKGKSWRSVLQLVIVSAASFSA